MSIRSRRELPKWLQGWKSEPYQNGEEIKFARTINPWVQLFDKNGLFSVDRLLDCFGTLWLYSQNLFVTFILTDDRSN
jgi:hypothetical protein